MDRKQAALRGRIAGTPPLREEPLSHLTYFGMIAPPYGVSVRSAVELSQPNSDGCIRSSIRPGRVRL